MAGVLTVTASVDVGGALADGLAVEKLPGLMDSIAEKIADAAMADLRAWEMNKTGRSRGNFRSALREVRKGPATISIPGPMIEGFTWAPWLEGTSKRNTRSRFKGYHLFALTADKLNSGKADAIAEAEVAKYVAEIGGG